MTSIDSLAKENTCFTKIISSLYENFKDAWGQDWAGNSSFSQFCPNSILLRDKYEKQEICSRSRLFPRPSGRSKILPTQISHGQTAPFNRAGPRCEIKNKNLLRVCTKYSPFWLTVKLKVATLHWKSALNWTLYIFVCFWGMCHYVVRASPKQFDFITVTCYHSTIDQFRYKGRSRPKVPTYRFF